MLPVQGRAAVKAKQWHAVQGCAVAQAPGRMAAPVQRYPPVHRYPPVQRYPAAAHRFTVCIR